MWRVSRLDMLKEVITRSIRDYLVGGGQDFTFKPPEGDINFFPIESIGIYIHTPFCKSRCLYCPYYTEVYNRDSISPYVEALLTEIDMYHAQLGKIEIPSVYIGGGTPTNLINELGVVIAKLKERFTVTGGIGIETSPSDINRAVVAKMAEIGITSVSLGVQSFQDKFLRILGRNYRAEIISSAIEFLMSAGFESVNIDLMFALPEQTKRDLISDLKEAVKFGVDQITTYPLFIFPHSVKGRASALKEVQMPNLFARKGMYGTIYDFCGQNDYHRVSVWGFKKGDVPRYSSVTRDNYVGFGAGAGSRFPEVFYFNTFSVEEYIRAISKERFPIALKMDIMKELANIYWLYWRLYDTYIPKEQLGQLFDLNSPRVKFALALAKLSGLYEQDAERFALTKRGSFWIHLVQNYFVLNYIDKVWSEAMRTPWPGEIEI